MALLTFSLVGLQCVYLDPTVDLSEGVGYKTQ